MNLLSVSLRLHDVTVVRTIETIETADENKNQQFSPRTASFVVVNLVHTYMYMVQYT